MILKACDVRLLRLARVEVDEGVDTHDLVTVLEERFKSESDKACTPRERHRFSSAARLHVLAGRLLRPYVVEEVDDPPRVPLPRVGSLDGGPRLARKTAPQVGVRC